MTERQKRRKNLILLIGIPAFLAGAVAAVILFELPGTLLSAVSEGERDQDGMVEPVPEELAEDSPGDSPSPAGGEEAQAVRESTDLMGHPAMVEMAVGSRGRYVSLTDPSGLWSLGDPSVLARTSFGTWKAGEGMPFAGDSIRLSLHQQLSKDRCILVDIEAKEPFELTASSGGRSESVQVPLGRNVLPTICAKGKPAGESMLLSLTPVQPVPEGTFPRLMGLWLADKGVTVESDTPPPSMQTCGAAGIQVAPDSTIYIRGLGVKGDELRLQASGDQAASLVVTVRTSPGVRKVLANPLGDVATRDADQFRTASWPLELDRQRPLEVAVSLGAGAPGPACLESMTLLHEPTDAAFQMDELPEIRGVIFVLMDTLRFDALPTFNPRSPVQTPILSEIAERSVKFTNATAHSNYTKPTVGSILTGVYPHVTGGLPHKGVLTSDVPLVSELLQQSGVQTVGLFSNRFLNEKFNFMRGWDHESHVNSFKACVDGEITSDAWVKFIESYEPEEPFFLYIHLMDPHAPYVPRSSALEIKYVGHRVLDGRFSPLSTAVFIRELRRGNEKAPDDRELKELKGLYRADVASLDASVDSIFSALNAAGLTDHVMVMMAADHGEEFMEHGYMGHGTNIHPELTHVPLMVRFPEQAPTGVYDGLVGQVDLAPTILDALGVAIPDDMEGESLLERMGEPPTPGDPPAYLLEHWNGTYGLRLGHWLVITNRRATSLARIQDQQVWYQDPIRHPVLWLYLRQRLALEILATREDAAEQQEAEIDEETRDQLEALGYVLE